MADAERVVTVKIRVVPDGENAKSVAEIGKIVDKATQQSTTAAKKSADAQIKEQERAAKAASAAYDKQAAEAVRAYSRIMREREQQAKAAEAASDREAKAAVAAYSKIMREREAEKKQIEALTEKMGAYKTLIARANLDTLQGAIQATKGFATLGLVGEDSSAKILKGLVLIQGAFDFLEGGFKIWKGLADGVELVNRALRVQLGLETLLAAIQARKTGAGGVVAGAAGGAATGAASGVAGSVAGGAVAGGAGAAGAGAATGGGLTLGGIATGAGFAAAGAAGGLGLNEAVSYLGRLAGFDWESPTQAVRGYFAATAAVEKGEKDLAKARQDAAAGLHLAAKKAADAAAEGRAAAAGVVTGFQRSLDAYSGRDPIESARAEAAAAQQRLGQEKSIRIGQISGGTGDARAGVSAALESAVVAQQRLVEAEKSRTEALKQQAQVRNQAVAAAQQELAVAQQSLDVEKKRYQSTLARFGALKETEQAELKRIAEKVKGGGEVSSTEARFLQQTGIGGDIAQKHFAGAGAAAGGNDVLGILGEGAGVQGAEAGVAAASAKVKTAQEELADTTKQVADAMGSFKTELQKLAETMNEALRFGQELNLKPGEKPLQVGLGGTGGDGGGQVADLGSKVSEQNQQIATAMTGALDEILQSQEALLQAIESRRGRAAAIAAAAQA